MATSRRTLLKNAAAAAAALSFDWTRAQAQAETVRIGLIYDLTGPFAAGGSVASSIGAQTAIDLVNEKGGIGGKFKVASVAADDSDASRFGLYWRGLATNVLGMEVLPGDTHATSYLRMDEHHHRFILNHILKRSQYLVDESFVGP